MLYNSSSDDLFSKFNCLIEHGILVVFIDGTHPIFVDILFLDRSELCLCFVLVADCLVILEDQLSLLIDEFLVIFTVLIHQWLGPRC